MIGKQIPGAPHETLISIDATTGQNGLRQAKIFSEAVEVDGVVLTKLDGTAKGGITLAIADELGIPVKLIGTGETLEDLSPFDPARFCQGAALRVDLPWGTGKCTGGKTGGEAGRRVALSSVRGPRGRAVLSPRAAIASAVMCGGGLCLGSRGATASRAPSKSGSDQGAFRQGHGPGEEGQATRFSEARERDSLGGEGGRDLLDSGGGNDGLSGGTEADGLGGGGDDAGSGERG